MVTPGCTKRLPRSGSTRPAMILSSVDLPEPLRPTRQRRSSAESNKSTPANSGVPPKVSAMSFNWISGGAIASLFQAVYGPTNRPAALERTRRPVFKMRVVLHRAGKCEEKRWSGQLARAGSLRTMAAGENYELERTGHDKQARNLPRGSL